MDRVRFPVLKRRASNRVAKPNGQVAPIENRAYGELVYWSTIAASVIVTIGSLIAFVTRDNFVSTSYWISAVWDGKSTEEIWDGAAGSVPEGHWYLSHLTTGDGLQALGLSVALISITLGMIAAGVFLFKKKSAIFGLFALTAAAVTVAAIFGIVE